MKNRFALVMTLFVLALGVTTPVYAQEAAAAATAGVELLRLSIITAGAALCIAACVGAVCQARGLMAAVEGIARNPAAGADIRGSLILGLVLIESLVIYVLLIALTLLFVKPFGG